MERHLIWLGLVLTIYLSKEAFAQEPKVPADVTTLVRSIKVLQARLRNEYLSPNSVNGFLDGDEIFPNIPALQQVKDMYTDKVIAKYYAGRKKRSVENKAEVQHREKRGIMAFSNSLLASGKWPNGRIDYAINQTLSAEQKSIITQALSWWTQKTCIQFNEVFQSNNPRQPYVLFTQGASCVSFVGRTIENVPQPTYLDANCFQLVGRIAHEVGHVIGLWHTHQLSTRGDYVTVMPNNMNVQNDGEIVDLPASIINYYNLPYDFASIMHYNPRIFARPGLRTIETRDPLFQQTIGQRSEISFQDAKLVNLEYCSGNCQNVNVRVNCQNGGYQDPANCGRCICADGWTGTLCTDVDSRRCGGDILVDGRGGSISTPGFDQFQTYQDNLLCAWRLRNTFGQNIVLEFDNRFGVYCFGDTAFHWVELRINGTLYATGYRFCGTQRPDNVFVSLNPSKEVMVVFKSPYNAPSSFRRTGFKLSYRMENQVGCNGGVCENGGTCNVADAVCVCRQGFIGIRCEVDDRCNQGYCRNGATCTLRPNAVPLCSCQPRFTGSRCQTAEPNPTPTPAPTPAPPQGDCGACGLPPGKTQVACNSTTETEEYEVLCETVADPARFSLFGGGGWGGRGRNRRRQTRWCTAELAKKYCCVNAVLMRVNNDFICGVPGWSDWGPCAGETCGGCGIRRRSQYEVIKQFDRNTCYNDRLVICGEEKTGCNFAPCPLDQCGTGNTQVRDDSWGHGWDSGSWEDSHEDHGSWFGRRKKRGLFDWLFGRGGGGGGGGGEGSDDDAQKVYDSVPRTEDVFNLNRADLGMMERLGAGNFGSVMRGVYKRKGQTIPVAIKTLKQDDIHNAESLLLDEAKVMAGLKHRNIVRLIGVCRSDTIMLVMELAQLGPLNKFLKKHQDLSHRTVIELMFQVAEGMAYLESKNFVHRDLAARNVLLVNERFAKLSDFGMSKALGLGNNYYQAETAGKWPLKWYAPECIYYFKFDSRSDVWSYGVTLWEALSYGAKPYKGLKGQQILALIEHGERLDKPARCPQGVYTVMLSCWNYDKLKRPSFKEIVESLRRYK